METTILFAGDSENIKDREGEMLRPFGKNNSSLQRQRPLYGIVALGNSGEIGAKGDLLWHIREDLRHFRRLTTGHPVIMGRITFESLPGGALPGRRNIVVSRNPEFNAADVERVESLEVAVSLCESGEVPFIIGGASIYEAAMPFMTRLYVTRVYGDYADADVFFPEIGKDWQLTEEGELQTAPDGLEYKFMTYERI